MSTVHDVTYEILRELGLTTIFGNPGSTEETFLADFPSDFSYVLALQESSVVAMADGYAQATGRPSLVNVHTVAGVGNAMASIMTAYQNRSPVIVTAGQQTREMLLIEPWLTNVGPTEMPRPWVKWAYEPVRAQDIPGAFVRAHTLVSQPPQGPAFLSLPLDDWAQPIEGPVPVRTASRRSAPDPQRLRLVADAICNASNPALVMGAGVDRTGGWDAGVALAKRLRLAVYTAPAAERASYPEDSSLFQGPLPFSIRELAAQLSGHDVVVVVGAQVFRYYPYTPGDIVGAGTRLWLITDDPDEAAKAAVGDSVLGDPSLALSALDDLLPVDFVPGWRTPQSRPKPTPPDTAGAPPTADAVFAELAKVRPDNAVLVEESPSTLTQLRNRWHIRHARSFFTFASGALGWGLPAAVGHALGERDTGRHRPVVAVIGDGSLQYNIQALWTAAQQRLPLLIVVPDNSSYAILKSFAQFEDTRGVPGLALPGLDLVAIARGYGVTAEHVGTLEDIRPSVSAALGRDGPTLLRIPVAADVLPLL